MKISVLTDISVLGFYGYIGYIGGYFYMDIDISEINKNTLKLMETLYKIVKMTLIMKYRHLYYIVMVFHHQNEDRCGSIATFDEGIPSW